MKKSLALTIIISLALAGCATPPSKPGGSASAGSDGQPLTSSSATGADTASDREDSAPVPPPGAQYTLHCAVFGGATHMADAKRIKDQLIRATHSNQWYVIHGEDQSDLYYGYYKTFDDQSQTAEYARAQGDRAKVSSLVDNEGDPLFPQIAFTPIDPPDPPAPAEWELSHNPGYWTLQIGVYRGSAQRKQLAVDAVRDFRAHGVEAYYRHGEGTSEVYVGSWPKNAVAQQQDSVAESDDPSQPLLVLPGPLPDGVDPDNVRDSEGRRVKLVMPKLVIVDPKLKIATEQYPYYYVNGEVIGHKVQLADHSWKTVPWPSYLVQVPHENAADNDSEQAEQNPVDQNPSDQSMGSGEAEPAPSVPGLGGLR